MFTLHWSVDDFGARFRRAGHQSITAHYDTLDAAKAQAEHDRRLGRHPLRIEDEAGQVVWTAADKES